MKKKLIKLFVMLIFVLFSLKGFVKNKIVMQKPIWINSVSSIYLDIKQCREARDSIEKEGFNNKDSSFKLFLTLDDSLSKLNKRLLSFFENIEWKDDDFENINDYLNFAGFSVLNSNDEHVYIISWDSYLGGEIPSYASVLIFKTKYSRKTIVLTNPNINEENSIVSNMIPTRICQYEIGKYENIYLVVLRNKCGNLCVVKKMIALENKNDSIVLLNNFFKNKYGHFNCLNFNYNITESLKKEPDFEYDLLNHKIFVPILNKVKTISIGNEEFQFLNNK